MLEIIMQFKFIFYILLNKSGKGENLLKIDYISPQLIQQMVEVLGSEHY